MRHYIEDGKLVAAAAGRIVGSNDIGMVAWTCFMKTPEYPAGREVVLVGNDCTFMSGSFGVKVRRRRRRCIASSTPS